MKGKTGRERRITTLVVALQSDLISELGCILCLGIKFNYSILLLLALLLIVQSENEAYSPFTVHPVAGMVFKNKISMRCI